MSQEPTPPTTPTTPPPASRFPAIRYDDAWSSSLLRPILIAVMVVCLDVGMVEIVRLAAPDLSPAYPRLLLIAGILSALMGGYTTTLLARADQRARRTASFRAAEIGVILLGLRLVLWAVLDSWPSRDEMLLFPLETLTTGDYFLAALIAFLSWIFANLFTQDFTQMALQPDELLEMEATRSLSKSSERPAVTGYLRGGRADRAEYTDRLAIVRRFAGRWIAGAVLLMFMTAAARFGAPQTGLMALTRQNIAPSVMIAAVVYLLIGLILISQGQLAALRARWALENILDVENVLHRWPIYATLLILGMGVLAALLPFGGTFRLAQILNFLLSTIQAIIGVFLTLFLLFLSLFMGKEPEEPPPPTPGPSQPLTMPDLLPPLIGDPLMPSWVGGAIFWVLTGLLLGYAALIYLRGRGVDLGWLAILWARLCQIWRELWQDLRGWQRTVAASLARQRPDPGPDGRDRPSLLRRLLGQMSPEEEVRYYYLDTVARAGEAGLPRVPSETPAHYAPRLQGILESRAAQPTAPTPDQPVPPPHAAQPSAQPPLGPDIPLRAVTDLTLAFEEVKYGAKPVTAPEASRIKRLWEAVKSTLQKSSAA